MNEQTFVLKGTICYSNSLTELSITENGYLVCEDGRCAGVFDELPEKFAGISCTDFGDELIIPGLTDLHLHAPQYTFRASGMDLELLDWLNTYTFPQEARYEDTEFAKEAYSIFTEDMKKSPNTRACIFGTLHVPATEILMEQLDKTGIKAMVGKVNMDRNGSPQLQEESAQASADATVQWIEDTLDKFENVKPILTPRLKKQGVYIAHCPQSNTNLSSGISPARRYLDEGLHIGLGSDIAGGTSVSILRAMADAIQVSKLYWRLVDSSMKPLTVEEAFYMGTEGGGSFFGKVGSFKEGYEFDAVVLNDSTIPTPLKLSPKDRLERLIYLSDDRNITAKYVAGRKIL